MVSALEARGLELTYPGGERALAGVDLRLEPGETVCVLGPNGSGKSTLLRVLGGVLAPDAGSVRLFGKDLARLSKRERARSMACVPQNLSAVPQVRVEHFVLGGRYSHRGLFGGPDVGERAAVERALAEADAEAFRGRLLSELSGGQWQRVLIARALAQEADVLLFDEPTASLDPEHQVAVFDLIARLTAAGRAALIATHELNLASRYAARILLLREGKVSAEGSVREVLCPGVLEPVYGPHLLYSRTPPDRAGGTSWPLVLPWPRAADGLADGEGDPAGP